MDGAIEVLVIERILVVPHSSRRISYLITHKPNPIVTRVRFDLVYRRASPSHDGRLHSHGVGDWRKCEIGYSGHAILTVGSVVIHIALTWVTLAPCVFVRCYVLCFREISRPRIERCV